jgi:putative transposase
MSSGVRRQDAALKSGDTSPHSKSWPHAPVHRLDERGVYIVTAGTYRKVHHLCNPDRLEMAMQMLFECAKAFAWELHAWAILANHYHFIGRTVEEAPRLSRLVGKLHMALAKWLNQQDETPGRRVWFQYWDTHITFERSYLARLRYVHQNPVHHEVVTDATTYRWCSAAWFEQSAPPPFVKSVNSFKIDQVKVYDDF